MRLPSISSRAARYGATLVESLLLVGCVGVLALAGVRTFGSSILGKASEQAVCVATLSDCGPGQASDAEHELVASGEPVPGDTLLAVRTALVGVGAGVGAATGAGVGSGGGTDTEPTFVVYDDTFVPRDKTPWLDEDGIQQRPMEVVIDRVSYDSLIAAGYTPEAYLQAHTDLLNEYLADAGVNMRVYIEEIRYVEALTSDQRGPWNVANSGNWPLTDYDAAVLPDATGIESSLIHEWGHSVLGLWDDYGFDLDVAAADNVFASGSHIVHYGPEGLMGAGRVGISEWVVPLLNARAAANEDYLPHEFVALEPSSVSTTTELTFDPLLAGTTVSIYQTYRRVEGDTGFQELQSTPVLTGVIADDGTFVVDAQALFEQILAEPRGGDQSRIARQESGIVMVEIQGPAGPEQHFFDLTDFVYAQQQATATGSDAVVIDVPPRSR